MAKASYRPCQFDGVYHHPDELILVPEDAPREKQKRLCLDHAEAFLKHLISLAQCQGQPYARRKSA
jgi:hypothetical protein